MAVALEAAAGALAAGIVEPTLYGDRARSRRRRRTACSTDARSSTPEQARKRPPLPPPTGRRPDRHPAEGRAAHRRAAQGRSRRRRRPAYRPRAERRPAWPSTTTTDRPRLVGVTDGGVAIAPTLDDKREIIRNAVEVFHRLGFARPRIALMSATEVVTPAMPSTVDAQVLAEEGARGELGDCEVFGPLALDNALLPAAAAAKGILSPVARARRLPRRPLDRGRQHPRQVDFASCAAALAAT